MSENTQGRSWKRFEADIKAIGEKHPTLQGATPILRALSFHKKCGLVELTVGYLELFPNQTMRCKTCRTRTPHLEIIKGNCFDCVAIEYDKAAALGSRRTP